jgi:hypothetical protein
VTLEDGKTYRFEGKTHDTVYIVLHEVANAPWQVKVLILESTPMWPHQVEHKAGSVATLHRESTMALKSVPL